MTDDANGNNQQPANTIDLNQQIQSDIDPVAQYDKAIDFLKREMFINSENCLLSIIPSVTSDLLVY